MRGVVVTVKCEIPFGYFSSVRRNRRCREETESTPKPWVNQLTSTWKPEIDVDVFMRAHAAVSSVVAPPTRRVCLPMLLLNGLPAIATVTFFIQIAESGLRD